MNEKKNLGEQVKDWWHENKKVIKVGATIGLVGFIYGMFVGHSGACKIFARNGYGHTENEFDLPCDDFGLNELNCDDPELL